MGVVSLSLSSLACNIFFICSVQKQVLCSKCHLCAAGVFICVGVDSGNIPDKWCCRPNNDAVRARCHAAVVTLCEVTD